MKKSESNKAIGVWVLITIMSLGISAQETHFGIWLSPVFPSSLKNSAGASMVSGKLGLSIVPSNRISVDATIAYNKFATKTAIEYTSGYEYESSLALIPVMVGFKAFFKENGPKPYFVLRGGYYIPAADFEKGGAGFSTGFGLLAPTTKEKTKFDFSIEYNAALGCETKEYEVYKAPISGGVTSQRTFGWASYFALNVGILF